MVMVSGTAQVAMALRINTSLPFLKERRSQNPSRAGNRMAASRTRLVVTGHCHRSLPPISKQMFFKVTVKENLNTTSLEGESPWNLPLCLPRLWGLRERFPGQTWRKSHLKPHSSFRRVLAATEEPFLFWTPATNSN